MINKQRVQRIKNLIYAFIILLLFLPLILMSVLSFQMFGAIKDLNAKVDNLGKAASVQSTAGAPEEASKPDSGYVLEPDQQVSRPDDKEESILEPEDELEAADRALIAGEDSIIAPEDVLLGVDVGGEAALPPADGGNELGGGAPLEDSEYLGATIADSSNADGSNTDAVDTDVDGIANSGAGNHSKEAEKELAANPATGYGDGAPSPDHTLNPSTGS